jgi:hypothetical protein
MVQQINDGVAWTVGGQAEVERIAEGTGSGPQITTAIRLDTPPTRTLTNAGRRTSPAIRTSSVAKILRLSTCCAATAARRWWLGYLDTGASDIVFWDVPKVTIYWGWEYVLVLAGPDQAASWRPAPGA